MKLLSELHKLYSEQLWHSVISDFLLLLLELLKNLEFSNSIENPGR